MEMEENSRPKLSDPREWELIRGMYFDTNSYLSDEPEDSIEQLDRLNSRLKNNNISSR